MAVDSTAISFSCNPLNELLANTGRRFEIGGTVIEYAPYSNLNVIPNGTKAWRPFGISETSVNLKPTIESYEAMAGQVSKIEDVLETKRTVEVPVSIICPTWVGKKFANGAGTDSIIEPASPITTTIDETPPVATNWIVCVASTTGFVVGFEVGIVTGDSTFGTEEEYVEIASIDTSAKTLTFRTPLFQLPIDGAAVRVIASKSLKSIVCNQPAACQVRIVKYDRSRGLIRVDYAQKAKIKLITGVDDGGGKVTAKYGFTLDLLAEFNIITNSHQIYETFWYN